MRSLTKRKYKEKPEFKSVIMIISTWEESRFQNSIYIHIKKKCLGINITKQVKDLCSENSKTLMKPVGDDTNRLERYGMEGLLKSQYYIRQSSDTKCHWHFKQNYNK